MSVAAQSPYCGTKRFFDSEENFENSAISAVGSGKRSRFISSPAGRCFPLTERPAYAVSAPTLAALRALFPEMDHNTIEAVLQDCGNDIDSAIRRLNELKLNPKEPVQAASAHAETSEPVDQDARPKRLNITVAQLQPWVDTVLKQMSEAKDMEEAKQKAEHVLQSFGSLLLESACREKDAELQQVVTRLRSQISELAKENTILKRAVAIQNGRLQELSAKDEEVQQLKQLIVQYQEKLHNLEVSNYSLALHLKQATGSHNPLVDQRRPDVF